MIFLDYILVYLEIALFLQTIIFPSLKIMKANRFSMNLY